MRTQLIRIAVAGLDYQSMLLCVLHDLKRSRVRNKQLPTCPSRVKFGGGNLILLKGCPQDNLKFSKKCLISSFLDELKYKFKAMTIGLYL